MVCAHGQGGGVSQCGHYADKGGRGAVFREFVRTSFTNGPLDENVENSQGNILMHSVE